MKSGLVSVSFRENSVSEIVSAAANAQLAAVEWGSDVHAPCNDKSRLREISRLQSAVGIICSSYGTYFRIGVNSAEELEGYFSAAEILGTRTLRVWCGDKASCEYGYDERMKIFEEARRAAELAERAGMTLCTEFHHHTFTDEVLAVRELLSEVDLPSLKTYWQPNQYKTSEENLLGARLLAPFTENVHIFSWRREKRFSLSDDKRDWSEYLAVFKKSKFGLLEFMPDDKIESLPTEAKALKELIK